MLSFVSGLALFLAVHSISIVNRGWRDTMAARLGEPVWKGLYTLVSLVGFMLLCIGYGETRLAPVVIYAPPTWLRHVAWLLLLPVFPLVLSVYLPGHLKARARHPLLLATKIWGAAHLLVNGNLADVLLFGGFLAWAVADRISVKRRPPAVVLLGPHAVRNDLTATIAGLGIYAAFLFGLHRWLIGVSPL
jgi:uncharacterized membrane protein